MGLLSEHDRLAIRTALSGLASDVRLVLFTQQFECPYCKMTHDLLDELVKLSPRLSLTVYDFVQDPAAVAEYGVDKVPAIAVVGAQDYRIRFYGVPAGYEFAALLEAIVDVARGFPQLPDAVLAKALSIDRPVHLQVLTSPSCPHCPRAVRAAHRLAMSNPHIRGDMVEVSEYPFLAVKYGVQGVPHTVVNETGHVMGGVPEDRLLTEILKNLVR
jgi:glutaredoxin-like protein